VRRFRSLWILILLALPGGANALTIGLYSDLDCSSCNLDVPPGGFRTFYVSIANDQLPYGPDGAEFRIVGLPAGWTASAMPNPGITQVIGNPLAGGVNVAWPVGLPFPCVLLYTVQIGIPAAGGQARLRVEPHNVPSNPNFNCPNVNMDWSPLFAKVCAGGGHLLVNSPLACTVGVETATWSQVKRLFD